MKKSSLSWCLFERCWWELAARVCNDGNKENWQKYIVDCSENIKHLSLLSCPFAAGVLKSSSGWKTAQVHFRAEKLPYAHLRNSQVHALILHTRPSHRERVRFVCVRVWYVYFDIEHKRKKEAQVGVQSVKRFYSWYAQSQWGLLYPAHTFAWCSVLYPFSWVSQHTIVRSKIVIKVGVIQLLYFWNKRCAVRGSLSVTRTAIFLKQLHSSSRNWRCPRSGPSIHIAHA